MTLTIMRPAATIAIALGDPAGIGAEVTLRALGRLRPDPASVVLVGCRRWLERSHRQLQAAGVGELADPAAFPICDQPLPTPVQPGHSGAAEGAASFAWLTRAVELVQAGSCRSLVTAPICKASWHAAGHAYPGQTERLAELAGVAEASMLFTARSPHGGWRLNTLLATTHLPLHDVAGAITREGLERTLRILHRDLVNRFAIAGPRILVAGLNPHAGESGHLGREEIDVIIPVLEHLRSEGFLLEGPLPADTLFQPEKLKHSDCVLAMYHDQGLPVLKYASFGGGINITLGLPIIRTSVDHGTALDLAGSGKANCESLVAAVELAAGLARHGRRAA